MSRFYLNDYDPLGQRSAVETSLDPVDFGAKDIGWQALSPAIGCTIAATVVVGVRWYTRLRLSRCHGLDDFIITLSLIVSWAMTAVIALEVWEGVGLYSPRRVTSNITKLIVIANNLWVLTVNITKASILAQYLRIFQGCKTSTLCYVLLAALIPATLWGILGGTLLCTPPAKLWHPELAGHCMSPRNYWLSAAGVDIGLDFLILLLPLPSISSLQLGRRQKFVLLLFFLLGFCVCAVSIARLVTVHVLALEGNLVLSGVWAIIWSTVEANVGIICACLLAVKPLVMKLFPCLVEDKKPPRNRIEIKPFDATDSQEAIVPTTPTPMAERTGRAWMPNPFFPSTHESGTMAQSSTTCSLDKNQGYEHRRSWSWWPSPGIRRRSSAMSARWSSGDRTVASTSLDPSLVEEP